MGILEELAKDETWDAFLQYKISKRHLSRREEQEWTAYIQERRYRPLVNQMQEPGFCFPYPEKRLVNKSGTEKKRVVYVFGREETMALKVMAFLLYRYDEAFGEACYSFRRGKSAKDAIRTAVSLPGLSGLYVLKADVSNYFNSIPADRLCARLEQVLGDDGALLAFLKRLLLADRAYLDGQLVQENRGAMAGTPIAPFFANLYLRPLDAHYEEKGLPYFRYSDDLLLFAPSFAQLMEEKAFLQSFLAQMGLSLNPGKVSVSAPGEAWEFLGISCRNGTVDLSGVTKRKMKAKIRRKARGLYRWRCKRQVEYEKAARKLIRIFNRKFYDQEEERDFSWSRWFFPLLTGDSGLREIDAYFLEYIRYLSSGRHYKGNYRITYEKIREMGYRSLVHAYYQYRTELQNSGK